MNLKHILRATREPVNFLQNEMHTHVQGTGLKWRGLVRIPDKTVCSMKHQLDISISGAVDPCFVYMCRSKVPRTRTFHTQRLKNRKESVVPQHESYRTNLTNIRGLAFWRQEIWRNHIIGDVIDKGVWETDIILGDEYIRVPNHDLQPVDEWRIAPHNCSCRFLKPGLGFWPSLWWWAKVTAVLVPKLGCSLKSAVAHQNWQGPK